jgi:hypothetical protein
LWLEVELLLQISKYPAHTPALAACGLFLFCDEMEEEMADEVKVAATKPGVSLDTWAVLLAFVLALLVRAGVLQHVAW